MNILYIASASILEPLIESQVLRYLEQLSKRGCEFTLVTFERKSFDDSQRNEINTKLARHSIKWLPRWIASQNRRTGILRDIRDTSRMLIDFLHDNPHDLVHARSFLPGNIAAKLKKKTGIPILYDMRGFWAKEKYAYGRIKFLPGKWLAQFLENRVFIQADHLVSLTQASIKLLRKQYPNKPIDCIPCCVDLDHFRPKSRTNSPQHRLVSVGSLGRGYRADAVFEFAASYRQLHPNTHLDLITRTAEATVRSAAEAAGFPSDAYTIRSVPHLEVATVIASSTAGICMIDPSESKIASCPTKLGEYLACGIPAVANIPIGDVEDTIVPNNVGVPIQLDADSTSGIDSMANAAQRLLELVNDPNLPLRARQEAESRFSVAEGAATYHKIYQQLTSSSDVLPTE
jgi:glycosyltransferase involved in cell wall biosynthesis